MQQNNPMNRICSETPLISILPTAKSKTRQHEHCLNSIKLLSDSANVLPTPKYTNCIQFQKKVEGAQD